MPIRLSAADVAALDSAGQMAFVVDMTGREPIPAGATTADLFGNGLSHVFGNFLSARQVRGGLAALSDDTTFLLAVRALADELYGGAVLDASPANIVGPQIIEAVYPDAAIVVVEETPSALTTLLRSPNVVRVAPGALTDEVVTAARAGAVARLAGLTPSGASAPRSSLPAPPVFVVGCPRSGTTWLQHLLASHPSIGGPDKETAAFVSVQALLRNAALAEAAGAPMVHGAVRRFLDGLFAHQLATTPGATRFLEKTPIHARHLDTIEALFPRAAVIGIHRDGRDVVRSLLQVDAGAETAAEAAQWWESMTRLVEAYAATHPLARDERYEELLADPVVGVVNLLQWLDLSPDAEVIETIRARVGTRVSQYNTTGGVGSGKWQDLPAADLRTIYRVAGERLVAMGYMAPVTRRAKVTGYFRRATRQR